MNWNIADPRALGFGAFAIAAWIGSMALAGFLPIAYGNPLHGFTIFVAIALLVAGIAAFLRREAWLAFFFILWSAASWGIGAAVVSGWIWLALALVSLYLWLGAKPGGLGAAIGAVSFLYGIDALGQGLHGVLGLAWAGQIGAYFGLAAALVAFYVSAAAVLCPKGCDRLPGLTGRRDPAATETGGPRRET